MVHHQIYKTFNVTVVDSVPNAENKNKAVLQMKIHQQILDFQMMHFTEDNGTIKINGIDVAKTEINIYEPSDTNKKFLLENF